MYHVVLWRYFMYYFTSSFPSPLRKKTLGARMCSSAALADFKSTL